MTAWFSGTNWPLRNTVMRGKFEIRNSKLEAILKSETRNSKLEAILKPEIRNSKVRMKGGSVTEAASLRRRLRGVLAGGGPGGSRGLWRGFRRIRRREWSRRRCRRRRGNKPRRFWRRRCGW